MTDMTEGIVLLLEYLQCPLMDRNSFKGHVFKQVFLAFKVNLGQNMAKIGHKLAENQAKIKKSILGHVNHPRPPLKGFILL